MMLVNLAADEQVSWFGEEIVLCAGKRETTQNIGHVKINIKDVVRNRRLQDVWALQVRIVVALNSKSSPHVRAQGPIPL